MKIRQGFVSNSSTSSFVVVGFDVDASKHTAQDYAKALKLDPVIQNTDDIMEWLRDHAEMTVITDGEDGAPSGRHIIGKRIAYWSSEDTADTIDFPIMQIALQLEEIAERLSAPCNVKVYVGSRCS